ncbi:MAG: hypothetical protein AVDCRST_MAG93-5416 [uncultured Chloroflexia bacterium]|uniref:Type 4 fimbrial biogenesis protein PilX N-terminal domain-containing protein n=1 Tax=uncultured Chloroflexia bacterium TaxID=1672391 RepID=A0A6J4KSR2_9CHLR|nr:MAG: hypothetical protein AVDCRST_MAG93-5416 [uncultured Chloroflexia bacterium]
MLQRRIKEESGMALPLAMMMVVMVGVMGAGFLVFVTRDLDSVIESNRGQTAFNLADAGVQAAKSHLLDVDAAYVSYDGITNLSADPPNPADSDWSCGVWDANPASPTYQTCSAAGKALTLDSNGNGVRVWIQYLQPATTPTQANDATGVYAPESTGGPANYPIGQDYFKVISQGTVGQTKRKVEAIFKTNANNNQGLPRAIYTPGNIEVGGAQARVTNMSLFAGRNIGVSGSLGVNFVQGVDLAFDNWNKAPNTVSRSSYAPGPGSCTATLPEGNVTGLCAGLGAGGTISGNPPLKVGRDYDGRTTRTETSPPVSCSTPYPQFRTQDPTSLNYPLTSGCTRMTFPFNAGPPDIDALRYTAQSQSNGLVGANAGDNYYQVSSTTSIEQAINTQTKPVWPAENKASTVVFVEFPSYSSSNVVNWNLNLTPSINCGDNPPAPPVRGTLVVVNGRFQTGNNMTPLRGLVVVSGVPANVPAQPAYTSTGTSCMQNFISASGDIKINGNVGAGTQERGSVPTSYSLGLVSWRELYK